MRFTITTLVFTFVAATLNAQETWTPPRLEAGGSPGAPVMAVSGGEVFLEVAVSETGTVSHVDVLRTTPPFTDVVLDAVRSWIFIPAERTEERTPGTPPSTITELVTETVPSRVFVAAIFRPPSLYTPTLGVPPTDVAAPTEEVAAPITSVTPSFPPQALHGGTVLTEVTVGVDGSVTNAEVVQSAAGFDEVAVSAARQWSFRPALVNGRFEETYAYVAFTFRPPLIAEEPPEPEQPPRPERTPRPEPRRPEPLQPREPSAGTGQLPTNRR